MGELFNTQHEYLPLIKERLIDFIRIHISQIGGLTGTLFGSTTASTTLRNIVTGTNQHLFANEYGAIVKRSVDTLSSTFDGLTSRWMTWRGWPSTPGSLYA